MDRIRIWWSIHQRNHPLLSWFLSRRQLHLINESNVITARLNEIFRVVLRVLDLIDSKNSKIRLALNQDHLQVVQLSVAAPPVKKEPIKQAAENKSRHLVLPILLIKRNLTTITILVLLLMEIRTVWSLSIPTATKITKKKINNEKMHKNSSSIFTSQVMEAPKTYNPKVSKMTKSMIRVRLFINKIRMKIRSSKKKGCKINKMNWFKRRICRLIIHCLQEDNWLIIKFREVIWLVINKISPILIKTILDHQNP